MQNRYDEYPPRRSVMQKKRRHGGAGHVFMRVLVVVLLLGTATLGTMAILQEMHQVKTEEVGEKLAQRGSKGQAVLSRIEQETGHIYQEHQQQQVEPATGKYGAILADEDAMQAMHGIYVESESPDRVTMAFAGDILLDDNYSPMVRLKQRGGEIASCFSQDLMQEMQGADVFVINNEFTYTNRGTPTEGKQYTFRAKPESVHYLEDLSVDVAALANNHAYDYGEVSLTDTLDTLDAAGIPHIGAGRNLEEAARPLYLMTENLKIALINATQIERQDPPNTKGATDTTPGVFRCWNPDKLYEVVRQAKAESDFVVVYIHWGTESTSELDWAQREQANGITEAGADLVIGNHSHCLQQIDYVNGKPVLYSLGNFWFNSKDLDTCLVKAVITEEGLESIQFLPARQKDCYTELLHGGEALRVMQFMNQLSGTAVIGDDGYVKAR